MNIVMAAADRFKWAAWGPCRVTRIHGWNNQGTAVYIQLQEVPPVTASTAPPNGTVPNVKSLLASANNGFDYEFGGGISLAELTVCCSTTETSLTLVAASGGLDMTIELDTVFDVRTGDAVAGDLTTGVNNRQITSNGSTSVRILRIDWACSHGTLTYLQMHTINSPPNGTVAFINFPVNTDLTGSVVQAFNLGDSGIVPFSGPSTATAQFTNNGCTLVASTTSGVLTTISDSSAAIRVIYGALTRQ